MLRILLVAVLVVVAVVLVRTITYRPGADPAGQAASVAGQADGAIDLDEAAVLEHLGAAIRFPTVSPQPPATRDQVAFDDFGEWLRATYPRVFETLTVDRRGVHTLLLTWRGREPQAPPVLLAAHYDVVPVIAGTEDRWTHPPFAGVVADGFVWGRGAVDNKNAVIGLLEAVDWLLARGFGPARTIYFSFGHDEELGGEQGAAAVVDSLQAAGVRLAWSLDEGSFVFRSMFPGVDVPVATINTAEKGSATLRIVASAEGGHSSMPPRENAVGRLARALVRLEDDPVPGGLDGLSAETFDAIGPHMPWLPRMMFANRWLFGPLVESRLEAVSFSNAMLRTTTAPTMLSASPKENVLAIEAAATVNFRLHPRDTVASVVEHVTAAVADEHVRVELLSGHPASAVAAADAEGFRLVEQAVRAEFGDLVVAPGLLVAATDSRHYGRLTETALRFNPMVVTQAEIAGFHGTDERIPSDGMLQGVRTYVRLLRNL